VVVHWQLPLAVGTPGMKIPALILFVRPARFGPRLPASPLRPAVVNFLAIYGDRWRRRDADRAWNSSAKCSMSKNGTRNAGISTSGRTAIGATVISPAAPDARL